MSFYEKLKIKFCCYSKCSLNEEEKKEEVNSPPHYHNQR